MTLGILLFFLVASNVLILCHGSAPVVEISTGKLKGDDKESRDDKVFYAYRGIPYATAKRFEAPEKAKNWTGVRDAKEYGKKCIQYSTFEKKVVGSEDCLFLNVFTPKVGDGISKRLLPVMVFIHGTFMDGTAEIYRAHYFMDEEIVIVTFNYRLNVFGFLSTGDEVIRGNMGLKDQIMALRWVQENIRKFGGDPNRVTLFGSGDGASSVHLLMLSPLSEGLFRKAITQSGSALQPSVIQRHPKLAAQRIARVMNCTKVLNKDNRPNATKVAEDYCSYENSSLILNCLRLVEAKKLAEVQADAFSLTRDPLAFFSPVVEIPSKESKEPAIITEHPFTIMSSGRQVKVPWMTGLNAQEGLIKTGVMLNEKTLVDAVDARWMDISPYFLRYDPSRTDITKDIRRFYLNEDPYVQNSSLTSAPIGGTVTLYPDLSSATTTATTVSPSYSPVMPTISFEDQFKRFTDMFGDRFYSVPILQAAQLQARLSPVYMYYYDYEGQYSLLDVYTGKSQEPTPALKKVSNWFKKNILGRAPQSPKHLGVCHGDELPLLFKYPSLKIKENAGDYQMSKLLVKLWVQFATDERRMMVGNSAWLPLTPEGIHSGKYLVMNFKASNNSTLADLDDAFVARNKFWSTLQYFVPFYDDL